MEWQHNAEHDADENREDNKLSSFIWNLIDKYFAR